MPTAYIFLRPSTPNIPVVGYLGHVAWGFEVSPGCFWVGSVENTQGVPYVPAGQTDFWNVETARPTWDVSYGPMNRLYKRYDLYKEIHVDASRANPNYAKQQVGWVKGQPYNVTGGNCMNYVSDILRAYGADLPDPGQIQNWAPTAWFNAINNSSPPKILMDVTAQIDFSLYEHVNLGGNVSHYSVNQNDFRIANFNDIGFNDKISSVVVRSGTLVFFEHINFQGRNFQMQGPCYYAQLGGANDQFSSLSATT